MLQKKTQNVQPFPSMCSSGWIIAITSQFLRQRENCASWKIGSSSLDFMTSLFWISAVGATSKGHFCLKSSQNLASISVNIDGWLERFHFSTENQEEQFNKAPSFSRLLFLMSCSLYSARRKIPEQQYHRMSVNAEEWKDIGQRTACLWPISFFSDLYHQKLEAKAKTVLSLFI